ncbi:hypothetical protein CC117_26805 [Parafrankia colletiae]|uniref:ATP-grasp domain-containing protein n=1 Tax=Parafrankia colletiae TaxID=573497 RepID=A0A1S1Q8G9_9ACTN|nr:hypothetical protein [Parafrankia colletiae]MCK9904613.1 hypothetical protein [Frankia sp. Cpl3]OHV31143.1 hypothetical protein CC117_26805 [Parafrankia colletiae]
MNIVILHRIPFAKIRYDLAVDHGRHVVRYLSSTGTTDGLPAGAGRRVLTTPTADVDALAAQHADWLGTADRLIARSEYDLLPAAHLRARFGIPGDLPADIAPLRDKWLMRTRAADAGIPQPAFWSVADFRRDPPATGTYLIKPRLEASSTGIETGDARQILDRLAGRGAASDVFVEEFVPGEIWHLDGYLRRGAVRTVTSSVYVGDCLNFAHGSPLGSAQTPDEPGALALLRRTLPVLGQRDGAFHFELIRASDGRFLFLETASRVGGAGVAETFELRTGVNLYQLDLAHQLFGDIEEPSMRPSAHWYGWFVFPAHHRAQGTSVDFDPDRFAGRLVSYVHNDRPAARAGEISYAAAATPLSGVVRGTARELRDTLAEICTQTAVLEPA